MSSIFAGLRSPWVWGIGVVTGLMFAPMGDSLWNAAMRQYDEARPVLSMKGRVVEKTVGWVDVQVEGEKLRPCAYVKVLGYLTMPDGDLVDTFIERQEGSREARTRLVGRYDLGVWRIYLKPDARFASLHTEHICDGRVVVSEMIKVVL